MAGRIKKRVFLLLTVWMLLLLATLYVLSVLETTLESLPDSNTIVSLGWAGYIVSSSFNGKREITAVSASWNVPQVNASAGDGYSSAWIGIGGQLDKTLIQIGTEHNTINGKATYAGWYEMLPDYSIRIKDFVLAPGHRIAASITLVDSSADEWNLVLTDLTNGQVFNKNFVYNSTRSSGEWIVERSTVNGQISSLSDFGSITFNDCTVDISRDNGVIGNFTYSRVHMTDQTFTRLASASTLSSGGSSFNVSYAMSI